MFMHCPVSFTMAQRRAMRKRLLRGRKALLRLRIRPMRKCKRPVCRLHQKVIKAKKAAVAFSADITGLDEMVLYTRGTVDGTGDGQSCMGNAKLVAADGSSV